MAEILEIASPQNPTILLAAYQISLQMTDWSLLSAAIAAPGTAELHMMMANQLGRRGDHANAIAQYRAAIQLNPKLQGVHFELAEQLRASSNPSLKSQAESEFKAALAIYQFDTKAWRDLGEVLADKGGFQAARQDCGKAFSLQSGDSDAETDMAIALAAMKEADKAIPLLESAVKHDPTNLIAHFRLSTLYRQTGKISEAEREMDTFRHLKTMKDEFETTLKETQVGDTAR